MDLIGKQIVLPTTPGGEIHLMLSPDGETARIKRVSYEPREKVVLFVPIKALWELMTRSPGFAFEGLSADELRDGLAFARSHGWGR